MSETAFEMYWRILKSWKTPLDSDAFKARIIVKICELAPTEAKQAIQYAVESVLAGK